MLSVGLKTTVTLTQRLHYQCLRDAKGTLRCVSIANSAGVLFTVLITQAWEEYGLGRFAAPGNRYAQGTCSGATQLVLVRVLRYR